MDFMALKRINQLQTSCNQTYVAIEFNCDKRVKGKALVDPELVEPLFKTLESLFQNLQACFSDVEKCALISTAIDKSTTEKPAPYSEKLESLKQGLESLKYVFGELKKEDIPSLLEATEKKSPKLLELF
jgi:hypothetical protein